ncbi:hypothetical protein [Nesterenkonia pannonica]|uniref:variant leucine-rich repeat-containing protein n=1 Tax=Nesterenkonia pannonica TaxID=1548602 RepID=UPI002164D50A|nr:hypothetical protein [Nesterenkonia pannonica]
MTSPQDDAAELEALASHPDTDWDVLHWIAENYPELRPAVAANPGTYQELIDALASLGDPEIDSAIAMRGRSGINSGRAATDPLAGMFDTSRRLPAYTEPGYQDYAPYPAAYQAQPVQDEYLRGAAHTAAGRVHGPCCHAAGAGARAAHAGPA